MLTPACTCGLGPTRHQATCLSLPPVMRRGTPEHRALTERLMEMERVRRAGAAKCMGQIVGGS